MARLRQILVLSGMVATLLLGISLCVWAQGSAEYAGAVSTAAGAAASSKTSKQKIDFPTSSKGKGKFRHLPEGASESPAEENRRKLEETAGEDAGTVLLRSEPTGARVWIEDKLVGTTPLLLVLSPGGYQVELRGKRMGVLKEEIEILPKEKHEFVFSLPSRYPSEVRLQ